MKDDFREDELLDEVLGETDSPTFRAGSLDQMLGAVQQRRRNRRRVQGVLAAFCLLASIGLIMRFAPTQHRPVLERVEALVVHSAPLPSGMIVGTESLLLSTLRTSPSSVALVQALPSVDLYEIIGDERLLALLDGRPAALIHHDSTMAELLFVNPTDANGFQIH